MQRVIAIQGCFSGAVNAPKIAYFERLQQALLDMGIRPVLINLSPESVDSACEICQMGEIVCAEHGESHDRSASLQRELSAAAALDAEDNGRLLDESLRILDRYAAAFYAFLTRYNIRHCLLWGQFSALNLYLRAVLEAEGIICAFVHLGLLPGTISFLQGGEMAESWMLKENDYFNSLPVSNEELNTIRLYLDDVRGRRLNRKPQPEVSTREFIHNSERPHVFYAGINDYCSGIRPRWHERAVAHSPFFEDTADGLRYLADVVANVPVCILFKGHPNVVSKHQHAEYMSAFGKRNITDCSSSNVISCIENSAVTLTILSQTAYVALIHEKPVILMGRMPLSGKGCVYELTCLDELEKLMFNALENGFTDVQRLAWYHHAARLWKDVLFSFIPEFDSLYDRGPHQAARWLSAWVANT